MKLHQCCMEKKRLYLQKNCKENFEENSLGENLPSVDIQLSSKNNIINIVDLIILSKIEKSKSEIRRLIKGKGIKINNEIISDEKISDTKKIIW